MAKEKIDSLFTGKCDMALNSSEDQCGEAAEAAIGIVPSISKQKPRATEKMFFHSVNVPKCIQCQVMQPPACSLYI